MKSLFNEITVPTVIIHYRVRTINLGNPLLNFTYVLQNKTCHRGRGLNPRIESLTLETIPTINCRRNIDGARTASSYSDAT